MTDKRYKKIAAQDAARKANKAQRAAMSSVEEPGVSPVVKIMLGGGTLLVIAAMVGLFLMQ